MNAFNLYLIILFIANYCNALSIEEQRATDACLAAGGKINDNVCCHSDCGNQCGEVGCSTRVPCDTSNPNMTQELCLDLSRDKCCMTDIRWSNRNNLACGVDGQLPPCLISQDNEKTSNKIMTYGDPHFSTPDGKHFSYQGKGDFWLMRSGDLEIQTKTFGIANDQGTFNGQIALRYRYNSYSDILEFVPALNASGITLYVNGDVATLDNSNKLLKIYRDNILYLIISKVDDYYLINCIRNIQVVVKFTKILFDFHDIRRYVLETTITMDEETYFDRLSGLSGNWNGHKNDDLTVKQTRQVTTNIIEFAESWRVDASDSFFQDLEINPTFKGDTVKFDSDSYPKTKIRTAKNECEKVANTRYLTDCITDYLVSDSRDILKFEVYRKDKCFNVTSDCSGHGDCRSGKCHCVPGWTNVDCSVAVCEQECSDIQFCLNGFECGCLYGKVNEDDPLSECKEKAKEWFEKWWVWVIIGAGVLLLVCGCAWNCGCCAKRQPSTEPQEQNPEIVIIDKKTEKVSHPRNSISVRNMIKPNTVRDKVNGFESS